MFFWLWSLDHDIFKLQLASIQWRRSIAYRSKTVSIVCFRQPLSFSTNFINSPKLDKQFKELSETNFKKYQQMIVPLWINPFAPSETSFQKTHQLIPKKTWRRKKSNRRMRWKTASPWGLVPTEVWSPSGIGGAAHGAAAHLEDVEIVEAERKSPPSDYGK